MNKDKYNIDERPIHQQVNELVNALHEGDKIGVRGILIDIDEMNTEEGITLERNRDFVNSGLVSPQYASVEEYDVGEAPDQTEEIERRHNNHTVYTEPTVILSRAIEQVEQMGAYKVMVALVDLDDNKPKEERLYTFCDLESKKLREVIYKEMEKEFE